MWQLTSKSVCHPYDVVSLDVPWPYRNKRTGGTMKSGASQKYKTISIEDLMRMPIRRIAAENAVIFMWVTTPFKEVAFELLKAWDLTYKTTLYWHKYSRLGMGFWFRNQVEEVYVATHGKVPPLRCQRGNIITTKVLKHSQKPPEFRGLFEEATRNFSIRRIELFARDYSDGWHVWGDEVKSNIELKLVPGTHVRKPRIGVEYF